MRKDRMVFAIHPDGNISVKRQQKSPKLAQLQEAVGGYIQEIPHFTRFEHNGVSYTRGVAYCNEHGRRKELPFNEAASKAWKVCLGNAPLWYEPHILGTVVFVTTAKGGEDERG